MINKDSVQRAFLKVEKVGNREGKSVLKGVMFDGTAFEFVLHEHEYHKQSPDCPLLVEVGLRGMVGKGICEISLPAPVLTMGHNVRVGEDSLIKWDQYVKLKEIDRRAKELLQK